jgi:hypothetical protein
MHLYNIVYLSICNYLLQDNFVFIFVSQSSKPVTECILVDGIIEDFNSTSP